MMSQLCFMSYSNAALSIATGPQKTKSTIQKTWKDFKKSKRDVLPADAICYLFLYYPTDISEL